MIYFRKKFLYELKKNFKQTFLSKNYKLETKKIFQFEITKNINFFVLHILKKL